MYTHLYTDLSEKFKFGCVVISDWSAMTVTKPNEHEASELCHDVTKSCMCVQVHAQARHLNTSIN